MKEISVKDVVIRDGAFNICVTLTPDSLQCLEEDLMELKGKNFDLIEWRADYLQNHTDRLTAISEGIMRISRNHPGKPLIFTFRWHEEGGRTPLSPQELLETRKLALESGKIHLLDIEYYWMENEPYASMVEEYEELLLKAKAAGIRCILSWHDFQKTPEEDELKEILSAQVRLGADICKISTYARSKEEAERIMAVSQTASVVMDVPHILLAMGEKGTITRYDRRRTKTSITYAPLKGASAPGQLSLDDLHAKLEGSIKKNE